MEFLSQNIISGLAAGSLYSLIALGLVLIYKTSGVVNFAHGEMSMFSTYIAFSFLIWWGQSFPVALFGAVFSGIALGIIVERLVLHPAKDAPVLSLIISTLAVSMILYGVAGWIWGYEIRGFPSAVAGPPLRFGTTVISYDNIVIFIVAFSLMLSFFMFIKYTDLGIAARATAQNQIAARLLGINVGGVFLLTWIVSSAMGAIAGVLVAPIALLSPNMMMEVLLKAVVAAILGGFNSLPGAVVGGLVLGVTENLVATYVSMEFKTTFAFLVMVIILMLRPTGILGTPPGRKA